MSRTLAADSKERFSSRVENYVKYRPRYPSGIVDCLRDAIGLSPEWVIVDLGSGTGMLSEVFLRNGNQVYGVEPNAEMRNAGERSLAAWDTFESVNGSSEATTLPDASIHLATAGQAFHWFEPAKTREELLRVLKPSGWVALIWNSRRTKGTPFLEDYERLLLKIGVDYHRINHESVTDETLTSFFGVRPRKFVLDNHQLLDRGGLVGRLMSSSYVPLPGQRGHDETMTTAQRIFDEHQVDGQIRIDYDTEIYVGQLTG